MLLIIFFYISNNYGSVGSGDRENNIAPKYCGKAGASHFLSVIEKEQTPDNNTRVVSFLHCTCEKKSLFLLSRL